MYQSEVARFLRTKSNDMIVTFLPILLVFALRSILRTADISRPAFVLAQVAMAVFLIAFFVISYWFYFRAFRYTLVERGFKAKGRGPTFPAGSLTFERLMGDKTRIYERVLASEALCLVPPGGTYDAARFGAPSKTFHLTALKRSTAYRLYYRQEGVVYCALFHPSPQQIQALRDWTEAA